MKNKDIKRYIYSFLITVFIFALAIFASTQISQSKINELERLQEELSHAVISNDFSDLTAEELGCQKIYNLNYDLSREIGSLAEKITYTEQEQGFEDPELMLLREKYTLLLIKDYITTEKVNTDCDLGLKTILFFYENEKCTECTEQGYVLTELRRTNELVRVYSLDGNLELGSQKILMEKLGIKGPFPAIYVDGKVYKGFQDIDDILKIIED